MRILFIFANYQGGGFYRCFYPGKQLEERGNEVLFTEDLAVDIDDVPDLSYDLYVFQLAQSQRALDLMRKLGEAGKVRVYDMDDDIQAIPAQNPAFEEFRDGKIGLMMQCMKEADAVTVATSELAELYSSYNQYMFPLPNCTDFSDEHWDRPGREDDGKVVIGWAGSQSHVEDFKIVMSTLERICRKYPFVQVAIGGPENIFDSLTGIPDDQKIFFPAVNFYEYPETLTRFDIGLVPLVDNRFNSCKSHLKGIEYGRLAIPFLASPAASYERLITEGENGFLCSRPREWLSRLTFLIENPDARRAMGLKALAAARLWDVTDFSFLWEGLYAALLKQKHASTLLNTATPNWG